MTRVFKPADAGEEQAFVAAYCNRCIRSLAKPCEILEAVVVNDDTDPDYPAEWIVGDDARPACTAFVDRSTLAAWKDEMMDCYQFGTVPPKPEAARPAPAPIAQPRAEPALAASMPCAVEPAPEVEVISAVTVGKGVIDACRLRPGKRAWSVPFAQVRELFDEDAAPLRAMLEVPEPDKARVRRSKLGVTITARSRQDATSVSSSVRLRFARRSA